MIYNGFSGYPQPETRFCYTGLLHQSNAVLIRRPSGYSYRQKIPHNLRPAIGKRELWVTLETNDRSLAKSRGCAIFCLTDKLFGLLKFMDDNELCQDANDIIREDLRSPHKSLFDGIIRRYEIELTSLRSQFKVMNAEHLLARVEQQDRFSKFVEQAKQDVSTLHDMMKNTPKSKIAEHMEAINRRFQSIEEWTKPKEPAKSPLFSDASEAFILASSKEWKDSDFRSYRNTFKRFMEVCGDKEIRLYTGADAGDFKEMMEKLPENYGRNKTDIRTVPQLVRDADRQNLRRVSGKSVKNHFSKMSSLWKYYLQRDFTDKNIFTGWNFDTRRKIRRVRWSDEYLRLLVDTPFDIATSISKETYAYIVAVGSYTGMRLEEICRLRCQDIVTIRGIPCIVVQDHEELKGQPWTKWSAKTEAGTRVIPIAEKLIEAGFLDLVEKSRRNRSRYIFSDLKFSGKDKKRSGLFQRNFSTHKTRLKIPPTTVFHSFRHYVSTKLRNIHEHGEGGLREIWLDDFLGHESENKSVGAIDYFDEVDVENLKNVADAVVYPDFWDIKKLMQ